MKILIMAGGEGTRLWPLSRSRNPKQLQTFFGNRSLLEQTLTRIRKGFSNQDIYISTLAPYARQIKTIARGLPKKNLIIEPVRRDRGPAIALAASIIAKTDPEAIITTAWADHYIPEIKPYLAGLRVAELIVRRNPQSTVLLGIKPSYPSTELGYIKQGRRLGTMNGHSYFRSEKFIEKPNLGLAQRLFRQGNYLWNPGMFVWQIPHLLSLYKTFSPKNSRLLEKITKPRSGRGLQLSINRIYPKLVAEEIENVILEKTPDKIVIPVNFRWVDIGTYQSLHDILSKNKANLSQGQVKFWGSRGNFIYSGGRKKFTAVIDVENLVVIDTKDVLLIMDRNSGQLKNFLKKIKTQKKFRAYL